MATRDILVLNTTASRAETQQGSDTVVIRGNSTSALSVENSSGTSILSVDTISSSINITGDITASGNFSSSLASSASFGRLEVTTLAGDAFNLTDTDLPNTISSSGQIATQISGAFRRGFEFTGTIGDFSPDNENMITASFGRIVATSYSGSAANLTNTDLDNTISSSAQLSSRISGSFNKGFEFTGKISGSATSTGSFAKLDAIKITGDVSNMSNITKPNTISGSAQIASYVSGSFNKGFQYSGKISGSATSTGSFTQLIAVSASGNISAMTNTTPSGIISSSAQIASYVSGSFNKGFEFASGNISGSVTTTGSFSQIIATKMVGSIAGMTGVAKTGMISGSGGIASRISGSFNKGFEYSGNMPSQLGSWSAGGAMINSRAANSGFGTKASFVVTSGVDNGHADNSTEEYNGTSWSEINDIIDARKNASGAGTSESGLIAGGKGDASNCNETEEFNGTNWSEVNDLIMGRYGGQMVGASSETALFAGGGVPSNSHHCNETEEWNGTNWSEVNDMISTKMLGVGFGNTEAAIVAGGTPTYAHSPYNSNMCVEEWNGTNWSEIDDIPTHYFVGGGASGTVNSGMIFGGYTQNPTTYDVETAHYDGSSWSIPGGYLSVGRRYGYGDSPANNTAIFVGGGFPGAAHSTCTEEYTVSNHTASFGRLEVCKISGDASKLSNITIAGTLSGSAQIASYVS